MSNNTTRQYMRQTLTVMICLLTAGMIQAQVFVNIQLPATGLTLKSQLWNLSLVNPTNADMNVQVEMTMTDISNNQRVLTATTRTFVLPKGVKQVKLADVAPVIYSLGAAGYNIDASPEGFLPVGIFNICYTVIKFNNDAEDRLSEDCETMEIEPLAPPQLMMPADQEQCDVTRPFFNWLPPSPFNLFSNLVYDWMLVEVQSTQSAGDAIQQNIPVLTQPNISFTGFQYPLTSPELDTSKLYAWRITAKNNTSVIAVSETWAFRVRKFGLDTSLLLSKGYYSRLRPEDDASYVISSGILRYEYLNELNSNTVDVKIFDISSSGRRQVQLDSSWQAVRYGQNFVEMNLSNNNDMVHKHIYLLVVTNARNERSYLRFEFRRPDAE
jgi:hypothetical protein